MEAWRARCRAKPGFPQGAARLAVATPQELCLCSLRSAGPVAPVDVLTSARAMADRLLAAQIQLLRGSLEGQLRTDTAIRRGDAAELPWRPGDRVAATIESLRGTERAILRVGNFVFDTPAPPGAFAGQKLDLVFVSASPRVTFALDGGASEQASPQASGAGRQVDISAAARRLESLVTALVDESRVEAPAAKEAKPLVPGLPLDTRSLASALQEHVTRSGMFYESHLEHWAQGRLALEYLRKEPQGRIPVPDSSSRHAAPLSEASTTSSDRLAAPATQSDDAAHEPVHPAALPQVKAQLEALHTGQIAWQGQAWPGQDLRMEIEEDSHAQGDADVEHVWTSRLRLELPRLGSVEAVLQMSGQQLRVRMSANAPAAVAELREGHPALVDQLSDVQLILVGFDVSD